MYIYINDFFLLDLICWHKVKNDLNWFFSKSGSFYEFMQIFVLTSSLKAKKLFFEIFSMKASRKAIISQKMAWKASTYGLIHRDNIIL